MQGQATEPPQAAGGWAPANKNSRARIGSEMSTFPSPFRSRRAMFAGSVLVPSPHGRAGIVPRKRKLRVAMGSEMSRSPSRVGMKAVQGVG